MHVRTLFANPSHNANSVTEFDFLWRANANANFVLLILRINGRTLIILEKRSCQLFYYCVHMARKTTPLCYVSFYVRCSVFHLGYVSLYVRCSVLDLPTGGSRVRCTCTADIVLQCSPCSNVRMCMREELPSLELLLVWAVLDISSPGLAFVSALLRPPFAEYYSMTGELTSSLWFICLCWLFHLRKVCWFWAECNKINNGKADRISLFPSIHLLMLTLSFTETCADFIRI